MHSVSSATAASQRARLAREISAFSYGGDGPTHGEIETAFAVAGVEPVSESKRDRVFDAVRTVPDRARFTLLDQLIDSLRRGSLPNADDATLKRLRATLRADGFSLDDDFKLHSAANPTYDHLPDLPALREHIDRIQRALRDGDDAQLLGFHEGTA